MNDLILNEEMREIAETLKQAGNPTADISFENGVGNVRYKDCEIRCMLPLTGRYDCVLQTVAKDDDVFYLAIPVMTENKEVQINNLVIKER